MTTRDLCLDCATNIYGATPPNDRYARATANLLWGTCIAESLGRYHRQVGFPWTHLNGAWGLWQTEHLAVEDNLMYLTRKPLLAQKSGEWLFGVKGADCTTLFTVSHYSMLPLCQLIAGWDRLACLMARLHYLRIPKPIPDSISDQAKYWKKYYNTSLGKGTVEGYLSKNQRSKWFE